MTLACSITSPMKSRTRRLTGLISNPGTGFDARMIRRTLPNRRQNSNTDIAIRSASTNISPAEGVFILLKTVT